MPRRLPYNRTRKNLWLRSDLVEFFDGALLAKPEEMRVGYGFNDLINELLEERKQRMLNAEAAMATDGYSDGNSP